MVEKPGPQKVGKPEIQYSQKRRKTGDPVFCDFVKHHGFGFTEWIKQLVLAKDYKGNEGV